MQWRSPALVDSQCCAASGKQRHKSSETGGADVGGSAQSDACSGRVAESWRYCRRRWGGAIISAAIDTADSTPPIGYLLL
ncbi:hypothetical protein PLUA15_280047 [Pseudomonas lundensis]|uniref:Uncharacterized protein n=1 Tax=Pseudomonas lundensis TaxID=86185 RepID=A0AAX2H920_9PSED|nr:hypothetical protein PLUA15_280047 [Pseudomonas lundensis]